MKNSSILNKPNSSRTTSIRNTLITFIVDDPTIQGNAGVPTPAWDLLIITIRLTMLMNWEAATWRDRLSILMITSMSWATYDHLTHCRKVSSTILNITSRVLDLHIHHQIVQTVNLTLGYHMDLPVTAPRSASCNHWSNLVIWYNSLILTIPIPKLNSPLHITVWLPRDGHQKLSACSQPG